MRKNIFHLIGTVCLLAVFLILSPAGSIGVQASTSDPFSLADHSGYCGKHAMWNFDEDTGTLTIAGTGTMYDYAPWDDYADEITKVVVKSGVTSIGSGAFSGCESLTAVKVSGSNTKYSAKSGVLYNKDKTKLILYSAAKTSTSFTIPSTVTTVSTCSNPFPACRIHST